MNVKKFIVKNYRYFRYLLYLNPYLYIYYFRNLRFNYDEVLKTKRLLPIIDPFIIFRKPKLNFRKRSLVIDNIYQEDEEFRESINPYLAFFNTTQSSFELEKINSVLDIGCSTGHLISLIKNEYPKINVKGIEYFEFHLTNSPENIKNNIFIDDIRTDLDEKYASDLVICTEVAEHIEPRALTNFINNLNKLTNKYLIMTWSNSYPDVYGPPQHVSSINYQTYNKLMKKNGFKINSEISNKFIAKSKEYEHFNYWWRESLLVFEKIS